MQINNIKCHEDGNKLKITFDWPIGLQQVYIFTLPYTNNIDDGKLYTLQEYKKLGGYVTEKKPGETNYYIYPYVHQDGECVIIDHHTNSVKHIEVTKISCQIREKAGLGKYKNHYITLEANYPVPDNIICYIKKKGDPSRDINDGTLYYWGDIIQPAQPVTRIVSTLKDEYISVFVRNEELYGVI